MAVFLKEKFYSLVMPTRRVMDNLTISNPRKNWVISELSSLIQQWESWQKEVELIEDQPYNKNTHSEVFADGEDNMETHSILQMKTVTFLDNNLDGHWFINGRTERGCDRNDLRLQIRVKHRLKELREIHASLSYALVADSFWKQKGVEVINKMADKSPEVALEIITGYLKNPVDGDE
jgi:hypothetical protein